MDEFDFSEALTRIKKGRCVANANWNGKNMHVYAEEEKFMNIRGGVFAGTVRTYGAYLVLFTADGTHQPGWVPSQADMMTGKWREVDPG